MPREETNHHTTMNSLSFILTACVVAFVALIICAIMFSAAEADEAMPTLADTRRVVCPCGSVQAGPHGKWVRPIYFVKRDGDSHSICPKCQARFREQRAKLLEQVK